jgi:2-(1,2-epoxy-1,2-dihydrophenyl)acetyl-CoA isomerase
MPAEAVVACTITCFGTRHMAYENILIETSGGIATLTLNRPTSLNSLNKGLIDDIRAGLRALSHDETVRALIVTGAGRGFCAGADLANAGFNDGVQRSVGEGISHSMEIGYNPLVRDLAGFPRPVVVAVNGVAAGGGVGLALSGDIVLASKSAYFVQVFGPKLGIVPDMGCTWFLPQLLGRARARALALLGDRLPAEKAAEWGLIWAAVDDANLLAEARTIAERLAKGPTLAFGEIKRALDAALENTLDQQLELERRAQLKLGDTGDFREGVSAFLTKREPQFKGK